MNDIYLLLLKISLKIFPKKFFLGYFGDEPILEPYFGKEELQIALWIHRFMRIVRFNCHAIREVSNNQNSSIGVAVNPTLAMINHSCDSNYGRVWKLDEDLVVAYATRPIKVIQWYYQNY